MIGDLQRTDMPAKILVKPEERAAWEVFKREYRVLAYNLIMGTDRPDTYQFWHSFAKAYLLGFADGAAQGANHAE